MPKREVVSFFDLGSIGITGEYISFSQFRNRKILVVNTASECGFTPQFEGLEELYCEFGPEKFVVIAFPSNDFGKQEPGTNHDIENFCRVNYGVTFPVMAKSKVTEGPNQNEVFLWLTRKIHNGVADIKMTWNFQKFAIDENGVLVKFFSPETHPLDPRIVDWLVNPGLF